MKPKQHKAPKLDVAKMALVMASGDVSKAKVYTAQSNERISARTWDKAIQQYRAEAAEAQAGGVKPSGLCSMCQQGTTTFRRCPSCGVSNCRHIASEHELQHVIKKIRTALVQFSPKMAAIAGALLGYDFGARDCKGGKLGHLNITSDGFVIAASSTHETGAFIGEAHELYVNLNKLMSVAGLNMEERRTFDKIKDQHITDWRQYAH